MDWNSTFGWANVIALTLFVAGYFVRWGLDVWERRQRRLKFYRAISTEIRLNVEGLNRAVAGLPSAAKFRAFFANSPTNRPHLISTYMCDIYESNAAELTQLPSVVIANIIEFYGMLEFLGEMVRSFEKKSFETISPAGREAAADFLIAKLAEAHTMGSKLCDLIVRELGTDR